MGLLDGTSQETYYEGADGTQRSGDEDYGSYQFVSLTDIINQFMVVYVGEDKLISKIKRTDVSFHAHRALQELSFDTLKSIKSQEIEIPPSLTMILPQDYVNYVKLTWSDSAGIEHVIYPVSKTSNPTAPTQDANGDYSFTAGALDTQTESNTWADYKTQTPIDNTDDFTYDTDLYDFNQGQRYGMDPQYSQTNGSFFIDENKGYVHFGSNIAGKTVTLKYISDSLGTDAEMKVHKFAEEAMYKSISYAILSTRANTPEYVVRRYQKDKRASVRNAKLRLSNIKLEEITQILRGKSKQIKH